MTNPYHIPPEEMVRYREAARRRHEQRRQALEERRRLAWETARKAAALLKERYGATRVLLFGSLARNDPLSPHSDVDLLAWGLDERAYYRIVAQLQDLTPGIPVDLVRAEEASPKLLAQAETEGILL